ncbi:MAG: CBS domain-containing protein [Acidilobus sp.]
MIESALAKSSRPVLSIAPETTVKEAAEFMASAGVRRLVVKEGARAIGVFSAYHLVKLLVTGSDPSSIRVSDAGLEVPVYVQPTASLLEAAKVMSSSNVTSALVGSEDNVIGVLTTHDIVAALARSSLGRKPLHEALAKSYPALDRGASLLEAAAAMTSRGVSGVLVVEGDQLLGVLTVREVIASYASRGGEGLGVKIAEVPFPAGAYVDEGATISEAAAVMEMEAVDVAPVLCGTRVCGAVDDITLTRWLASSS